MAGKPAPASWTYLECLTCRARFKRDQDGTFSTPTQSEWDEHCGPAE